MKRVKFISSYMIFPVVLGISACSGGGSCTGCGTNTASPTFSITAPTEYPAGIQESVYLTMYNNSSINASNIQYRVESNTTGAIININPNGAGNNCTSIAAESSCVFTAEIESGSNPGSFVVTATGTATPGSSSMQSVQSTNFSANVSVNIGLVTTPDNSNPLYLLPSNQTLSVSSNNITAQFSVLVESATAYPLNLMNGDGSPITPPPVLISGVIPESGIYQPNSIVTFSVTYAPNQQSGIESIVAYGTQCSGNNCNSNIGYVNFATPGAGILQLSPSNTVMSPSYTTQIYTLNNTGESTISLTLPSVTSPFNITSNSCGGGAFTLTPAPSAGSSCNFTITYTPQLVAGAESFPFSYNDGVNNVIPASFAITYSPTQPVLTWMNGESTVNGAANYGTINIPADSNVPGARYLSVSWTESNILYMFGGNGSNNLYLNDLWQYDTTTNLWTWISGSNLSNQQTVYGTQGVESITNMVGGRQTATAWVDESGNLWLYGGYGYNNSAGRSALSDLWEYDINTKLWVWMGGVKNFYESGVYGTQGVESLSNIPGARLAASSWTDESGNLWLFGGNIPTNINQMANGIFNDLWRYNVSSGQWTWMNGASSPNQVGIYGTLGVESSGNTPGARSGSATWVDKSGNLWLFGGSGYGNNNLCNDTLNDLWRYDINTGNWAWMGGSKCKNAPSNYGIQGVPDSANMPGARYGLGGMFNWTDNSGNFWLFGGVASQNNKSVRLNDLWVYNVNTGLWTWIAGSNTINQAGIYGTKGVGSITNIPSARYSEVGWSQGSTLWLFGGWESQSNGIGYLNDLWKIDLPAQY